MSKWNTESFMTVAIFPPDHDSPRWHDTLCWTDDSDDLPESIDAELKRLIPTPTISKTYELEITFQSKGYYDKGVIVGPPEKCYPPEGEDERTVILIDVVCDGFYITHSALSETTFDAVYDRWETEINDAEFDTEEDYYQDTYGDDDFDDDHNDKYYGG